MTSNRADVPDPFETPIPDGLGCFKAPVKRRPIEKLIRRVALAAQPALRATRLTFTAWRAYERSRAKTQEVENQAAPSPDGFPIPPPYLQVKVAGHSESQRFFAEGLRTSHFIAETLARHSAPVPELGRILDFGCGCGRVTRHWPSDGSVDVHGSDHDAELIGWVRANLPFVTANHNQLAPPLPYPDAHFGLVYAISVFTHLTAELGLAWMAELQRIVRPGGFLLFSVTGPWFMDSMRRRERAAFDRGELVVQFAEGAGSNLCLALHPASYVHRMIGAFDCVEVLPPHDTAGAVPQEVWLTRRPAA